jgi:hypothetical protein
VDVDVDVEVLVSKVARVWRGLMFDTYRHNMKRIFRRDENSDTQNFVKLCKKPFQGKYHLHIKYIIYTIFRSQ